MDSVIGELQSLVYAEEVRVTLLLLWDYWVRPGQRDCAGPYTVPACAVTHHTLFYKNNRLSGATQVWVAKAGTQLLNPRQRAESPLRRPASIRPAAVAPRPRALAGSRGIPAHSRNSHWQATRSAPPSPRLLRQP